MEPKWEKLASLAQKICALWFQFFGAVFASKGYPFKNILKDIFAMLKFVTKACFTYISKQQSDFAISCRAGGGGGYLTVILVRVCRQVFLKLPQSYTWSSKNDLFIYLIEQNVDMFKYFSLTLCCL